MRFGGSVAILMLLASSPSWAADGSSESSDAAKATLACRRSFGFAAGVNYQGGALDWEQVGQGPWAPTLSPVLGAGCAASVRSVRASIGVESAPWYIQVAPNGDILRQWATGTLGVSYEAKGLSVGPLVTAGFTGLGAGVEAEWSPGGKSQRIAAGGSLGVRFTAYRLGAPGYQGMVLYSLASGKR